MSNVHLPLIKDDSVRGSILADGHRKKIVPADVKGRFATARKIVLYALVVLSPFLVLGGLWWVLVRERRRRDEQRLLASA